jgi:hypothetical protein
MPDHTANAARFAALYGDEKWCKGCEEWKALTEFYPLIVGGRAYLQTYCIHCSAKVNLGLKRRDRAWRAERRRALAEGWPG